MQSAFLFFEDLQTDLRLLGTVRGCCGFNLACKLDVMFGDIPADVTGTDGNANSPIAKRRIRVVAKIILNGRYMHNEGRTLDVPD